MYIKLSFLITLACLVVEEYSYILTFGEGSIVPDYIRRALDVENGDGHQNAGGK